MTKEIVSLFSGAGGLDLGFFSNGFRIMLANDKLGHMAKTYKENFKLNVVNHPPSIPDLPVFFLGDVSKLKMDRLEGLRPDVVAGGPPCQDFSIIRGPEKIAKGPRKGEWERAGIKVSRGKLYSRFVRALAYLQPKTFVFENVPGLMSSNRKRTYPTILEDFSKLNLKRREIRKLVNNNGGKSPQGYEIVFSDLVDASKLGVPQARKRLIVMGVRKDFSSTVQQKLPEVKQTVGEILRGKSTLLSKYPLTPIEVFEGRPLPDLQDKYVEVMKEYEGVAEEVGTQKAQKWKRNEWEKLKFEIVEDYLTFNKIEREGADEERAAFKEHTRLLRKLGYHGKSVSELDSPDGSNRIPKETERTRERMRKIPPGQNHEFVRGKEWEVEGRGISLVYRRTQPLKPSYTVVAYGGGGTWGYHYERERGKLTNRERARLQTFPDSFAFEGNSSQVRAQIGEAVPPLLGKKISEAVGIVLKEL